MRRPWTAADEREMTRLHRAGYSSNKIAARLGRRGGSSMIGRKLEAAGLVLRGVRKPFTPEEDASIRTNFPNFPAFLIAHLLERRPDTIYRRAAKLGVKKSPDFWHQWHTPLWANFEHKAKVGSQFKKGRVPANKGKRRPGFVVGKMASTQFKNGQKPHTWMPVGSLRVDPNGYTLRKLRDDAPPGQARFNWRMEHVLLWEEHLGQLPPGHIVVFKNGDRRDIRCDNLACISLRQNLQRNSLYRYPKEIVRAIQLRGALTRSINRATRNADNG